ncbi:MAG: hypothetical protein ACD_43C00272G0011 [uncultured bacterium]|nr:MAG: hypothetical protein ACD_43C00272G0011 [uncultured bacterium]
MSKRLLITVFISVSLFALVLAITPFYLNNWFITTPDAGGLACAAETLIKTGHFSDGQTAGLGYNFNVCWTKEMYPVLQIVMASLLWLAPALHWLVVPITTVIMFVFCVFGLQIFAWRLTKSVSATLFIGIFASTAPMLLRPLILTPQNVFGYALIIVVLIILHELHLRQRALQPRWWLWLLGMLALLMLGATHTLSFGITGIVMAIWFFAIYLKSWKYRLVLLGGGAVLVGAVLALNVLPISLTQIWAMFHGGLSGYDHPLYDHPAIWGYIATSLAAVGIFMAPNALKLEKKTYWFLLVWLLVPLLLGHVSWFGLTLLPDRFIAFTWISITVFAGLGLVALIKRVRFPLPLLVGFVTLLLGAQTIHAITYCKDDVMGWSDRFQPHAEFIEALSWLNQQPSRGTLIGIMAVANREITFAPIWYDGPVASYPWYNLNHKNIKSFKANSSLYKTIFAEPQSAEYLRVEAFYTIITKPNSAEAKTAAQQYNLSYLILPIDSQAGKIWQKAAPEQFTLIYENTNYHIYQLQ